MNEKDLILGPHFKPSEKRIALEIHGVTHCRMDVVLEKFDKKSIKKAFKKSIPEITEAWVMRELENYIKKIKTKVIL